ncbi:MAG: molybdenum cofactor guanylyltransferase [Sphingomonadales bacterium]|nr:molybdenum cofactor guanylyltransferase [Sphingomonadales bacterium]
MDKITATAIIAGGKGRRAGGNKAGLILAGKTLFDHAAALARGYTDRLLLVVRDDSADMAVCDMERIYDCEGINGPLAGIAAALDWGNANGCTHILALACDTPFLPADLLTGLYAADDGRSAVFAQYDDRLQPLASLWPVSAQAQLPAYISSGKMSVIGFGEHIGLIGAAWPQTAVNPFFNINDADDLFQAEQMFMLHLRNESG